MLLILIIAYWIVDCVSYYSNDSPRAVAYAIVFPDVDSRQVRSIRKPFFSEENVTFRTAYQEWNARIEEFINDWSNTEMAIGCLLYTSDAADE